MEGGGSARTGVIKQPSVEEFAPGCGLRATGANFSQFPVTPFSSRHRDCSAWTPRGAIRCDGHAQSLLLPTLVAVFPRTIQPHNEGSVSSWNGQPVAVPRLAFLPPSRG